MRPDASGERRSEAAAVTRRPPIGAAGVTSPSIGFQRQFGTAMAFEADYVNTKGRNEKVIQDNTSTSPFNPATGVSYPFADISRRPAPGVGHDRDEEPFVGYSELPRIADGVHQAVQSAVAGIGDLYAGTAQGIAKAPRSAQVHDMPWHPVPGRAGSRRAVHAGGDGSAPSRHLQRHLGSWIRGAAERPVLLRFRPAEPHDLRQRPPRHGNGAGRALGPVPRRRPGLSGRSSAAPSMGRARPKSRRRPPTEEPAQAPVPTPGRSRGCRRRRQSTRRRRASGARPWHPSAGQWAPSRARQPDTAAPTSVPRQSHPTRKSCGQSGAARM